MRHLVSSIFHSFLLYTEDTVLLLCVDLLTLATFAVVPVRARRMSCHSRVSCYCIYSHLKPLEVTYRLCQFSCVSACVCLWVSVYVCDWLGGSLRAQAYTVHLPIGSALVRRSTVIQALMHTVTYPPAKQRGTHRYMHQS